MAKTVLVGAQWGDEGKGKIIDFLSADVDWIVRYQGGNNAGHTVEIGAERYVLHLIPSGVLSPDKKCVIGNGVVIDPLALVREIQEVRSRGFDPAGRLFISDRAHVVFPFHAQLDGSREDAASACGEKIGTTRRGIGPAYADKTERLGVRMCALLRPDFATLLDGLLAAQNRRLIAAGGAVLDAAKVKADLLAAQAILKPFIADTVDMLFRADQAGESILFEGAQGTMLDVDFGTYPYVTSSNPTAGGACTGTGVPPHHIQAAVGILKAYTTRVGEGPFPTELIDATGERLRKQGHEFGATTGRPRRCGWFDAVVARYSRMINGFDFWALTKIDVLDEIPVIRMAVAYECDGQRLETIPADVTRLARCRPIYEDIEGWMAPTTGARTMQELPPNARAYIRRLEELTGVPVGILSVGPQRASTFLTDEKFRRFSKK